MLYYSIFLSELKADEKLRNGYCVEICYFAYTAMKELSYIFLYACSITLCAGCNTAGEIKVQNRISKTTVENIYWGEVYIGGALRPGQETEYFKIKRADEKLPAAHNLIFSVEGDLPLRYYTIEKYELDKKGQLNIELTDSTEIYEL